MLPLTMRLIPLALRAILVAALLSYSGSTCPSGYQLTTDGTECYSNQQYSNNVLAYANCCPSTDPTCGAGGCTSCNIVGTVTSWWTMYQVTDASNIPSVSTLCAFTGGVAQVPNTVSTVTIDPTQGGSVVFTQCGGSFGQGPITEVQFVPIGQSASPACVGLSTIDSETISLDPQHPTTIYFLTCGWPQVSNGDIDYSWFGSSVSTNACPVVGSTYPAGGSPHNTGSMTVGPMCVFPSCNCQNGGTCGIITSPTMTTACMCPPEWTGSTCSTPVDHCTPNPCTLPNTVCVNLPTTFQCDCKPDFQGNASTTGCFEQPNLSCANFSGHSCSYCLANAANLNCSFCFKREGSSLCLDATASANSCSSLFNQSSSTNKSGDCPANTTIVGSGVATTFLGDTPDYRLSPRDGCGDLLTSQHVELTFSKLVERSANGSFVQSLDFPADLYTISLSAIGAGFTGFFPVVGNISLNINTVQNLTVIDYANTSFTLDPNTNKWSIDMQGWPFESHNNTLSLVVMVNSSNFEKLSILDATQNPTFINYLLGNSLFNIDLELPTLAIVDGRIVSILPTFDASSQAILIGFPAFKVLSYDPNLSVLLSPSNSDNRNSACSSSSDNTLLIILTSVLIPLALLAILLVIVGFLVYIVVRKIIAASALTAGTVNFGGQREIEETL